MEKGKIEKKRKLFVCPEVNVPRDLFVSNKSKRLKSSGEIVTEKSNSSFANNRGRNDFPLKAKSSRDEVRSMMSTIKEFNANSLTGTKKKNYNDDILTRLGAPPPKQPTMPFQMRMGINADMKRRAILKAAEAKEAGLVLANSIKNIHSKKAKKSKSKK